MPLLMMLQGGPLDGEQQIVGSLPNSENAALFFSLPNYQFFDETGATVVQRGLECTYRFSSVGPQPGAGDTWEASYVFEFAGGDAMPRPPGLYPALSYLDPDNVSPPGVAVAVDMYGSGLLTVTNITMPMSGEPANYRGVTYYIQSDSFIFVQTPALTTAGYYDFVLWYIAQDKSQTYIRYPAAFTVGTLVPAGGVLLGTGQARATLTVKTVTHPFQGASTGSSQATGTLTVI